MWELSCTGHLHHSQQLASTSILNGASATCLNKGLSPGTISCMKHNQRAFGGLAVDSHPCGGIGCLQKDHPAGGVGHPLQGLMAAHP